MATHSKGIHGLPQCYGTRDAECANRGCMWDRGCAAETWTAPREWVDGERRVIRDSVRADKLRNGHMKP